MLLTVCRLQHFNFWLKWSFFITFEKYIHVGFILFSETAIMHWMLLFSRYWYIYVKYFLIMYSKHFSVFFCILKFSKITKFSKFSTWRLYQGKHWTRQATQIGDIERPPVRFNNRHQCSYIYGSSLTIT